MTNILPKGKCSLAASVCEWEEHGMTGRYSILILYHKVSIFIIINKYVLYILHCGIIVILIHLKVV